MGSRLPRISTKKERRWASSDMERAFTAPAEKRGPVQQNGACVAPARGNATGSDQIEKRGERNLALDFTKGLLVLLMVLYHWVNYFVSREGDFYKYLRFITPSFIFITGFLVANVYLAKYDIGDLRLHKRLVQRGVKLLALFTLLNLAVAVLAARVSGTTSACIGAFLHDAGSTYLTGNGRTAAFVVLVPISYLLILSPVLLILYKWHRSSPLAACGLLFLAIYIFKLNGVVIGHLELFAIGVVGMVLGCVPIGKINRLARHRFCLVTAYVAYIAALTVWQEIYPLQVIGVCLNLIVIYMIGLKGEQGGAIHSRIILLGKYSLLAYIVQIGFLLVLSRVLHLVSMGAATKPVALVAAVALTMLSIEAVDYGRKKYKGLDVLYKAVFA
jgi:peptidoglycan/LPS O-acetylase OafA/YrhL